MVRVLHGVSTIWGSMLLLVLVLTAIPYLQAERGSLKIPPMLAGLDVLQEMHEMFTPCHGTLRDTECRSWSHDCWCSMIGTCKSGSSDIHAPYMAICHADALPPRVTHRFTRSLIVLLTHSFTHSITHARTHSSQEFWGLYVQSHFISFIPPPEVRWRVWASFT